VESGAKRILRYWFPVILVAAAISILSTQRFGESHTARIVIPVLHWIFPWASLHTLHLMNMGIRELGHVTGFGLLSILLFRAWRADRTGWCLGWSLVTLLIVAGYALLNEIHQIFVPGQGAARPCVTLPLTLRVRSSVR
jgi:VanZ family protein